MSCRTKYKVIEAFVAYWQRGFSYFSLTLADYGWLTENESNSEMRAIEAGLEIFKNALRVINVIMKEKLENSLELKENRLAILFVVSRETN